MKPCLPLMLVLCVVLHAQAQAPLPVDADAPDDTPARIEAERERLQEDRVAIDQHHDARMRECWQRFAVNNCLRDVRRSRRAALDPLRARELELNVQERAWRTLQREERLRNKQDTQERRP